MIRRQLPQPTGKDATLLSMKWNAQRDVQAAWMAYRLGTRNAKRARSVRPGQPSSQT